MNLNNPSPMMKTVQEVLSSGTEYLESRGIDAARHSMQSLMVHVLGCNKTWLYLHFDDPLPEVFDTVRHSTHNERRYRFIQFSQGIGIRKHQRAEFFSVNKAFADIFFTKSITH